MADIPTQVLYTAVKEDQLASLLGEFGRWQLLVFGTMFLVKLTSGCMQMAILFLTPKLTFWCGRLANLSTTFGNSSSIVMNNTCYQDCLEYKYDPSPFTNTIITEWDLVCERRWLASFTQTVLQLGVLMGSILFGFLSDRYGRKKTFLVSITTLIMFGFGVPFSPNYIVFTGLRFFLGMSIAGTTVTSFVITVESIGSKYRSVVGCLYHIPFVLGHMIVPLFAYYFRSWNSYTLALAVPSLIYLGYFFTLTESPRWLVSTGRVEKATRIVQKAALLNKLPTAMIEETLKSLSEEIGAHSNELKLDYRDLFRATLRRRTVCCCVMWLISGVNYFGFNQYISQTSPSPIVSVAATVAAEILSNLISIWLIDKFGRKSTTATFFILGGVCVVTLAFVPNRFWISLTLGTLGISCIAIVNASIYIYVTELFPTVVRNMGIGVTNVSMRIGSMIAPFISNLSATVPWLSTVMFGLASIFGGVICLWLPETKGKTLPYRIEEVRNGD